MSAHEQAREGAVEATQDQATQAEGPPRDAEALARDIERTREELGETVQALAAKADVKARAHDKAAQVKGQVTGTVGQVSEQVADKAGQVKGQVVAVGAKTRAAAPEPVRQAADRAVGVIHRRDVQLAVTAAAVLLAGWLVFRMRRR
jgi:hypothetical protein